ncbi:hypothetical protein [Nocardioides marinquilinus]
MTDRTDQPHPESDTDADDGPPSLEGVADFNVVVADEAARAARERARLAAEAAEAAQAAAEQAAAESRRHHDRVEDAVSPAAASLHDVAEVSKQVIAAMRAINLAHHAHIESLELEAARRCELATAQAELDAELIRLHARREAHAVIAAARLRAGEIDADSGEPDQLGEIGETFSRFAETIEIAMAPGPEVPDPRRRG